MSTYRTSGDRFKRHLSILHPTQVRSMLYGAMTLVAVGFLARRAQAEPRHLRGIRCL